MIRALDHLHGRQVALKVRPVADDGVAHASALRGAAPALALAASGAAAGPRGLLRGRPVRHRDGLDRGHGPRGVARRRGHARARPGPRHRLPRTGRRGARAPPHSRPTRRARRRQAGEPDPHLVRPDRPRRLRTVLDADRRAAPGGHGRLSSRPRSRRGADRPRRRTSTRSPPPPWRCSPAKPLRGRAELGRDRAASGSRRWSGSCARTWPPIRRRRDASAAAFVARLQRWWGADLPTGDGHARAGRHERYGGAATRRTRWTRSPRARGHCVSPGRRRAADCVGVRVGPGRLRRRSRARRPIDARVAAVTGEAEPRAGTLRGGADGRGRRLLEAGRVGEAGRDRRRRPPRRSTAGFRRRSASPSCATARSPTSARGRSSAPRASRSRRAPAPARIAD